VPPISLTTIQLTIALSAALQHITADAFCLAALQSWWKKLVFSLTLLTANYAALVLFRGFVLCLTRLSNSWISTFLVLSIAAFLL